jgi:hypothetical protein
MTRRFLPILFSAAALVATPQTAGPRDAARTAAPSPASQAHSERTAQSTPSQTAQGLASAQADPPAAEGEQRVQRYLTHGSFSWNCERNDHFQLCFDSQLQDRTDRKAAARNAETARKHVLRLAGVTRYRPTIHVFFLPSRARMKELIGYDGEGRSRPAEHAVFSVVGPYDDLTHEMSHEILSNLWGAAEHWIEEGFATWAYKGAFAAMECRRMMDNGVLIPLSDLVRPEWEPTQFSADITYPELAGFVSFLRDRYGADRLKSVWRGGAGSVAKVYGKGVPDLEEEWHAALRDVDPSKHKGNPEIIQP